MSDNEGSNPAREKGPRWLVLTISGLTALGVLGAIGGYYMPGILDRIAGLLGRSELKIDVQKFRESTPNFVFPQSVSPDQVPITALARTLGEGNNQQFGEWADKHGGLIANEQRIRIGVQGRTERRVTLQNIRIIVVRRGEPRAGWFNGWTGCGEGIQPRHLKVDLDADPPSLKWQDNGQDTSFPGYTVTSSDEEFLDVNVFTTTDEVEWELEIVYSAQGKQASQRVNDNGKPFLVTSVGRSVAEVYDDETQRLVRQPKRDHEKDVPC